MEILFPKTAEPYPPISCHVHSIVIYFSATNFDYLLEIRKATFMGKFGVMCLEGEWSDSLSTKQTVLPVLELLEQTAPNFKFIHRRIATIEEFKFFINKWKQKKYDDYKILYIASHGSKGSIDIEGENNISIEELGQYLEDKCQGRYVYLGGCNIMESPEEDLFKFLKETGAKGLIGYTEVVDPVEAAGFEMLLFEAHRWYNNSAAGYVKRYIEKNYGTLSKKLGFKFIH